MKRLLSGIQPTGELTIGNYIGAIKQFNKMQKDYESFVFVADLHSLTINPDPKVLRERIRKIVAIYLACGLDPKEVTLFLQSENIYHTMLLWALECHCYTGELGRMTQFKEKSASKNNEAITCGLFTYPVLQAADILIYDADVVPIGTDQKQHLELTRDIAERFNSRYGKTFTVPEPIIPKTGAKIMNLQDPTKKMSKTDPNPKGNVYLLDDLEVARKKIMAAVTDSENKIKYDYEKKPGISNLITIYSVLTNNTIESIEAEFKGANYGTFKAAVADEVVKLLADIQAKYYKLIEGKEIDKALDEGLKKVSLIAKEKAYEVYHKLGVGRY